MSDHEPSYYEIALTNRQVMVAFVILLVCMMGTFFTGVWVGRGDQGRAAADPSQTRAAVEEQPVEELDFFGGGEVAEPSGDAVEQRHEIPADEVARPGQDRPAPPREDPVVQRNRRGDGAPAGEADLSGGEGAALSSQPPAPAQVAKPSPAGGAEGRSPGTPPNRVAPPTTSRPVPTEGRPVEGPVVQVFSSHDREQAQKIVDQLTDGGQPAYMSPTEVDGQTMFRVRIGPFQSREQAERVADQVKRKYRLETWITQ